jgi:hypothetical protein
MARSALVLVVLVVLLVATATAKINYRRFATRAVSDGANYPIDREGTVFWGVGSTNIYFAGGVNTLHPTASDFTAFTDIYTYDTANNKFIKAEVSLPGPSYFGAGGFIQGSLVIFSGRTNTQPTPWTYFSDLYVVNFTNSITSPTVKMVTLKTPVTPRAFHSAAVFRNQLYIFGGVTGPDGSTPIEHSELFLAIDIRNGTVTKLPCDEHCPSSAPISPAMYLDSSEELIYLYSGMGTDFETWGDNTHIRIFDMIDKEWKDPVTVQYRNNFVFNGLSDTLQADHELLIIGGDDGEHGSHAHSHMLDLMQNPPQVVDIEHGKLLQKCESLTFVGVDPKGNIWAYGGATYPNSSTNTALGYCHGVVTMEYYRDSSAVGAGTKWFVGIAMVLVTAAIVAVTVYLYKRSSARRDYVEIP